MGRLFVATDTTHKVDYGSPAVLDNLTNAGAITVLVVCRRNSTNDDLLLASKSDTVLTKGWEFHSLDGIAPFTLRGRLRTLIWTDGNFYDIQSTAGDILPLNTHAMVGFTLGGGAVTMYGGRLDTPIPAVAMTVSQAGTGTPREDASSNYYGWNLQRSARGFDGDGSWQIVYNVALTLAQIQTVQQGVLTFRAGIEAGDSAMQTRGINIMKSVSGYVLLGYVAADGTCTDHSGNGNNGTLTGSAVGAELTNVLVSQTFEDSLSSAADDEQTTYRHSSDFAKFRFTTTATAMRVWTRATLDPATYPNQAVLGYDIDGVWTGKLSPAALGLSMPAAVTGMSSSSKEIALLTSTQSNPDDAGINEGVWPVVVCLDAAATIVAPPTRTKMLHCAGDSVLFGGFLADSPQRYASPQVLRRDLPAWLDSVRSFGAGGNSWFNLCEDANARSVAVARLTAGDPAAIAFCLGHNDKGRDHWAVATAEPNIVAFLDDLLAAFTGQIYIYDVLRASAGVEASANAFGEDLADWRTLHAGLAAQTTAPARVTFVDTTTSATEWNNGTTDLADGVHPTTASHQLIYPFFEATLVDDPGRVEVASGRGLLTGARWRGGRPVLYYADPRRPLPDGG